MKMASVVGVLALYAATTMAADLPKEGMFSGTYTSVGTFKSAKIGDRGLVAFDETGLQVTNGFADHTTFHCWGTDEVANDETTSQGYCVAIDPSRDMFEVKFAWDKRPLTEMAPKGTATLFGGTGKYAGLTGTVKMLGHRGFRTLAEGTYVVYNTFEGNYKLP